MYQRSLHACLTCLFGAMAAIPVWSQDLPVIQAPPVLTTGKLAPSLQELAAAAVQPPGEARRKLAQERRLSIANDSVDVEIDLRPGAVWDSTVVASMYGAQTIHSGFADSRGIPFVWAKVPINALDRLIQTQSDVLFVRPPAIGVAEHTTQGAELSGAALNFHQSNFKGQGIKVAIIDLGFDRWEQAQSLRELPDYLARAQSPADCTSAMRGCLVDFTSYGPEFYFDERESHGTAVAEIVHDMAPEADLYLLHVLNAADLRRAVDFCIQNGIKVISHSVAWFNESIYDGRGTISRDIADYARDNGILWVNSAGNHARQHYQGIFFDPDKDGWHNFDGGDETINLRLQEGTQITAQLTWSAWNTCAGTGDQVNCSLDGDYEIYLLDSSLNAKAPIAISSRPAADTKPYTILTGTIKETGTYHLALRRSSGSRAHLLALFVYSSNKYLELGEYRVTERSMPDPAVSEKVLAVGAVNYTDWKSADALEEFSSLGPTNGGLMKPDICAPDRVDTYIDPGKETKILGFTFASGGFAGTSAAAPHVAGAAALLWSRFPDSTATDIRNMLEANTRVYAGDLRDNFCGSGFLNLPKDVAQPSLKLVSGVRIVEPGPYYPGQLVTAQFTVQNTGTGCIFLGALAMGGRTADNSVIDFPWRTQIVICAGEQYTYTAMMKLPSTGSYHFFATFKTSDGVWNTSLPGAGPANTIDIAVGPASMVLMGIDGNQGANRASLVRIDRRTGAATVVGQTSMLEVNDIAFTPDGALYGVTSDQFLRINPLTGAAGVIGDIGYSGVNGLVSDSAGRLYAGTISGELLSINPFTGQGSLIGNFGSGLRMSGDLAFAPNGTLYGTSRGSSTDQLIQIDPGTGRATVVGDIGFGKVYSLAFDQDGVLLAGADGDTRYSKLIRINTTTGAGTPIGTITNANGLNGLALGREPQSWSFFRDDLEGDTSAWSVQKPWAVTAELAHSPTHAWSDSPGGNYGDDINRSILTPIVSLGSLNGATLRFWHRFDVEDGYDHCEVWITTDFGKNYERLVSFTGRSGGWLQTTIDLTRYVGAGAVWLAFQIVSDWNTNGDGWHIDDVELVGAR